MLSFLKKSGQEHERLAGKVDSVFSMMKGSQKGPLSAEGPVTGSEYFRDMLDSMHPHATSSDEDMAVRLAGLYFKEIARTGFKRSLELDSVINAYFYSLARIKRKSVESKTIVSAMEKNKSGILRL